MQTNWYRALENLITDAVCVAILRSDVEHAIPFTVRRASPDPATRVRHAASVQQPVFGQILIRHALKRHVFGEIDVE
jgi:hypothetical protein